MKGKDNFVDTIEKKEDILLKPGENVNYDTYRALQSKGESSMIQELQGNFQTIDSSAAGAFDLKHLGKRNDGSL